MKKNHITTAVLAFLLALTATAQTQYSVSTDIQKRKILLEELTGIHCGFCPEGHKVAQVMLSALPQESFAVNIHAGHYAVPNEGEPDYRTAEGDSLDLFFGGSKTGYPSGSVCRELLNGYYLTARTLWLAQANYYHEDSAPVNLLVRSAYDGLTRELTVHVEGYFTADMPEGTQTLSVLWTQDDVVGVQNGGSNDYHHQHMLRDYITPLWGDTLTGVARGTYFSRDYSYSLPEKVGAADVVPGDIHVLAFVTTDKVSVANVEGGRPLFTHYREDASAELQQPTMPASNRYGYNFFEATLKNLSAAHLTSATFDVSVGGQTETKTISCDISQFEKAAVSLPCTMHYAAKGKTKYSLVLRQLNGLDVAPDTLSGSFQKPATCATTNVRIQITTDECASQNTFILRDADGNLVQEFGPYTDGLSATYDEEATGLQPGQTYCLEVSDAWGDGMLEGTKGSVIVRSGAGKLIDQYYTVNSYGLRSFFTIDTTAGISAAKADATENDAPSFTLGGHRATAHAKGLLIKGGKKTIAK